MATGMMRGRVSRAAGLGLGAALVVASLMTGSAAFAQTKDAPKDAAKDAKKAAPAAAAPATKEAAKGGAPAQEQSAWVKLCEAVPFVKKDKDGKEQREDRKLCLTHHERLDGNTGMVLVSAAVRQIEGQDKQNLMVMVPLGMAVKAGMRAAVYPKELWEKVQKNEKVDEKQLKPVEVEYTICHPAGCTGETEATPDLVNQMKAGGGLIIIAVNAAGQPIAFPVPLVGFDTAYAGQPVDNAAYAKARGELMQQIRQRQIQEFEKAKAEQTLQQLQGGGAPQGGQAPAAQPAAPAKK